MSAALKPFTDICAMRRGRKGSLKTLVKRVNPEKEHKVCFDWQTFKSELTGPSKRLPFCGGSVSLLKVICTLKNKINGWKEVNKEAVPLEVQERKCPVTVENMRLYLNRPRNVGKRLQDELK